MTIEEHDYAASDPTLCADYADTQAATHSDSHTTRRPMTYVGLGILTAMVLTLLVYAMVKFVQSGETTQPSAPTSVHEVLNRAPATRHVTTETVTVAPATMTPATTSVMPPATTVTTTIQTDAPKPEKPTATTTNPVVTTTVTQAEAPATMTNPVITTTVTLPEAPATMTNPLEPAATMTNPSEGPPE